MACSAGIFRMKINHQEKESEKITAEYVCLQGGHVEFPAPVSPYQEMKRFVTFLGKKGYKENFLDSQLMTEKEFEQSSVYDWPGGPSRALYLSNVLPEEKAIGFIMANGEKIVEWIHWLPFVRFARSPDDLSEPILQVFEIWHPRPHTKDGILMSTSPQYSIFRQLSNGQMIIDVTLFQRFYNPSRIRSTLLVCANSNNWAQEVVQRYGYRKIQLPAF
jgi:hypothetical protein